MSTRSQPSFHNGAPENKTMMKSTSNGILLNNNYSVPEEGDEDGLTTVTVDEQQTLKQAQKKAPFVYINPVVIIEQER